MEETLQLLQKIENDDKWVIENYETIEKQFSEQYIAIEDGEVVESGRDFDKLLGKLKENGKDPSRLLIKFVFKTGSAIIF